MEQRRGRGGEGLRHIVWTSHILSGGLEPDCHGEQTPKNSPNKEEKEMEGRREEGRVVTVNRE